MSNITNICEICGLLSNTYCSICKKVYYCGKEHQKLDWSLHKKTCKKHQINMTNNPIISANCNLVQSITYSDSEIIDMFNNWYSAI